MYSTRLEDRRYLVRCIRVTKDIKTIDFIVDTGAQYSCVNYRLVDCSMCEASLADCDIKFIRGVIEGETVKLYKYRLKQFTIGNIDMGEQDIWVTFDRRVTDTVLGMDILQQLIFIANPYDKRIYFCEDVGDYERHFRFNVG
ncbi:MAG: aspartyl protease family protein [Roseburia sp.]|nr:aspartyl protease family protein [Roseburia sp.]